MKEMLHILHIPKWYPNPEDPQLGVFVKKQIQAASAFDIQSVLFIKSVKELAEPFVIKEIIEGKVLEVHVFYRKPESRAQQFLLLKRLHYIGAEIIIKAQGRPDLLHVHNLITPAIWAQKYTKKHNIPWVLSEHWSGYTDRAGVFKAKMKWERKLWQWYSEKAKCTIAVSSFLLQALSRNKIGKTHKVIPNVVEGRYIDVARDDNEIRILNVSDMVDEVKNISGLLRAFLVLLKKVPNAKLYLVGGGDDLDMLKSYAKELGLNEEVKFFGRMLNEDVLNLYNEIDFVTINSRIETFSVVAAESLIAGKPVISTRCGGVEEFVDDENGILISIDNDGELEKALMLMVSEYKNYSSENLSAYAKKHFSKEAVGDSLSQLYRDVVS